MKEKYLIGKRFEFDHVDSRGRRVSNIHTITNVRFSRRNTCMAPLYTIFSRSDDEEGQCIWNCTPLEFKKLKKEGVLSTSYGANVTML